MVADGWLRQHMERSFPAAELATSFRKMCGESTFIPAAQLHHIRKVGSGSFATVEMCRHSLSGGKPRLVAVKRLTSSAAVDVARFASEANTLRCLHHPNIDGFVGVGSEQPAAAPRQDRLLSGAGVSERPHARAEAVAPGQAAQASVLRPGRRPLGGPDRSRPRLPARRQPDGSPLAATCLLCFSACPTAALTTRRALAQGAKYAIAQAEGPALVGARLRLWPGRLAARPASGPAATHGSAGTVGGVAAAGPAAEPHLSTARAGERAVFLAQQRPAGREPALAPVQRQMEAAGARHEAYVLTGRAGSFMYMAPEVSLCQPYDEKVDLFSLGVILFELLLRTPLPAVLAQQALLDGGGDDSRMAEAFAYKVAAGWRDALPADWPPPLRALIGKCWAQDPGMQPTAARAAARLRQLEANGVLRDAGVWLPAGVCSLQ